MPTYIRGSDNLDTAKLVSKREAQALTGLEYGEILNIPDWVTEIEIALAEAKSTAATVIAVQLGGDTAYDVTHYTANFKYITGVNTGAVVSSTTSFPIQNLVANESHNGVITLKKVDNDTWAASYPITRNSTAGGSGAGVCILTEPLTRIRIGVAGSTWNGGNIRATLR